MGFNECSIDVVRRDRFNLLALHDCFHRVFSLCENLSQNEVTTTRVSGHYRNDASAIPGTISAWCAKSLHSEHFLAEEMCLCVMWNRHCPSIDSAPGLTVALDSVRPRIVLMLAAESSPTGERHDLRI